MNYPMTQRLTESQMPAAEKAHELVRQLDGRDFELYIQSLIEERMDFANEANMNDYACQLQNLSRAVKEIL